MKLRSLDYRYLCEAHWPVGKWGIPAAQRQVGIMKATEQHPCAECFLNDFAARANEVPR